MTEVQWHEIALRFSKILHSIEERGVELTEEEDAEWEALTALIEEGDVTCL